MLKLIIKSISVVVIVLITMSFKGDNTNYQTECKSLDTDGYVTLKIWDTKKGANYKAEQARKDAVHAILFSGVSGVNGCATQRPILNSGEERKNFKDFEYEFFTKKGKWTMFSRSAMVAATLPTNIGDVKWKVYEVSIAKLELAKYLEERKIIKKLNDGF